MDSYESSSGQSIKDGLLGLLQNQPDDEQQPRTLHVSNLDPSVSQAFIATLFGQIGEIIKCDVYGPEQGVYETYAIIQFRSHRDAAQALTVMNKRQLLAREMRVNWATAGGQQQASSNINEAYQPGPKVDTSKHYHIFVGDLASDIDNKQLHDAFIACGEVSEAKVIRDPQTFKSKGYGFVSFPKKEEAEAAIEKMNGAWLGRRAIRTNWASRKGMQAMPGRERTQLNYDDVFNQTGPTNTTVYVGGITSVTGEDDLRAVFAPFGQIIEVRIFKTQGYAFVRYATKEQAATAIVTNNNKEINGQQVRCSWGRASDQVPTANYGYGTAGYGTGTGQPSQAFNANNMQQYWQNYYQYYNNPGVMQQWMNYYQQGNGQN